MAGLTLSDLPNSDAGAQAHRPYVLDARSWGLDRESCEALLGALVDASFLKRTPDGAFVRPTSSRR